MDNEDIPTCYPNSPNPIITTVTTNPYMKVVQLQKHRQLSFTIDSSV